MFTKSLQEIKTNDQMFTKSFQEIKPNDQMLNKIITRNKDQRSNVKQKHYKKQNLTTKC